MDKSLLRLNLQLFATTMTTETGSLSAEMKTFYEKRLLDRPNRCWCTTSLPGQVSHSAKWRQNHRIPQIQSPWPRRPTAITEGVTPDGQQA